MGEVPRDEDPAPPWASWLVFAVALAFGAVGLGGAFVLDDAVAVVGSRCVTGSFDPGAIFGRTFWCEDPGGPVQTASWRPFTVTVWWFTWHLGAGRPFAFHLLSVVLHASAAALLYRLGRALGLAWRGALTAGLTFAVLAIHAEVAGSVVGAAAGWSALFTAIALLGCLREDAPLRLRALAVVCGAALACLSREDGVLVAPLALLTVLAVDRRVVDRPQADAPTATERRHRLALAGGAVAAVMLVLVWRASVLGGWSAAAVPAHVNPMVTLGLPSRAFSALGLVGRYHAVLVTGGPLAADYAFDAIPVGARMSPLWVAGGAAAVLAVLAWLGLGLGLGRRDNPGRRPELWLSALWWLGGLALVVNLFLITPALFAERMIYPASMAPCLAVGCAVAAGLERGLVMRRLTVIAIVGWGAWQAGHGAVHVWRWNDARRVIDHTVSVVPDNARARTWAAEFALRHGDPEAALEHARLAQEITPDQPLPLAFEAAALDQLGRPEPALAAYRRALALAPENAQVTDLFIQFLLRYGHVPQAQFVYGAHARARGGAPDPSVTRPPASAAALP